MLSLEPPQEAPKWTHTPEEVLQLTKDNISDAVARLDQIAALKQEDCTFESVFEALAEGEAKRWSLIEPLTFYQHVSTSTELRDASMKADGMLEDFRVEASMRLDVFRAKQVAAQNIEKSGRTLSSEEQRLVDKMLLDGRRAGLALPDRGREELTALRKELSHVCREFEKNYREANGVVTFTMEELEGVPDRIVSGYAKRTVDGKDVYDVRLMDQDINPLLGYVTNPETRRTAYEKFENRVVANKPIMRKMLDIRRKIAKLLGYKTWADYVTEVKMVKTGENVDKFLDDVEQKLRPLGLQEYASLLALKRDDCEQRGIPFDGELYNWEAGYYEMKATERELKIDAMLLKEYLPVSHVVPAILAIYQNLLGVKFTKAKGEPWHENVEMYAVWDEDAQDATGFVGYCYLDLYTREYKHPHASVWCIVPGYDKADGLRNYPVATIVANLSKPNSTEPALMRHWDVVTLFHEMGHVFHELLSRTRFSRFHGTTVALDFGEAPSQMLENWCWEPKVLKLISGHYKTGKPLDDEFIEKLLKSRYHKVGLFQLRQVFMAKFDLKVHLDEDFVDYTELWNTMRTSTTLTKAKDLCAGECAFNHIAKDYSAGYYGYLYSLVFAADMYATIFKEDPLDPKRGRLYREKVLRPGSSKDELDILQDFLGRPPSTEAFVMQLLGPV